MVHYIHAVHALSLRTHLALKVGTVDGVAACVHLDARSIYGQVRLARGATAGSEIEDVVLGGLHGLRGS